MAGRRCRVYRLKGLVDCPRTRNLGGLNKACVWLKSVLEMRRIRKLTDWGVNSGGRHDETGERLLCSTSYDWVAKVGSWQARKAPATERVSDGEQVPWKEPAHLGIKVNIQGKWNQPFVVFFIRADSVASLGNSLGFCKQICDNPSDLRNNANDMTPQPCCVVRKRLLRSGQGMCKPLDFIRRAESCRAVNGLLTTPGH